MGPCSAFASTSQELAQGLDVSLAAPSFNSACLRDMAMMSLPLMCVSHWHLLGILSPATTLSFHKLKKDDGAFIRRIPGLQHNAEVLRYHLIIRYLDSTRSFDFCGHIVGNACIAGADKLRVALRWPLEPDSKVSQA